MLYILLRWMAGAVSLYLAVLIAQAVGLGVDISKNIGMVLITVLVLALVNAFIRPILALLAAPLNCLTLGFFNLVLNALMFLLVGYFHVGLDFVSRSNGGNFIAALAVSLIMTAISTVLNMFLVSGSEKRDS